MLSVEVEEKRDEKFGPAGWQSEPFKRCFQPHDEPIIELFPNLRLSRLRRFENKTENTIMPARKKGAALAEFDTCKNAEQKILQAIAPIRQFGFPLQVGLVQS